ncbi:hypothetical protein M0R45_002547 [Rubus argutus]|uniref:Uncharacterized protein n=1 Tax=Rubus argutus TaxID=59490 RepID=A0AAW1VQ39_RUBAR
MTSFAKGGIEIETETDRHRVRSDDDDHHRKQFETHKGNFEGGKTIRRKSEKRKALASCPKCRSRRDRARAKTEKAPLPEGCGYLCSESGVDADGHYYEVLSNLVGYMSCLRCGVDWDWGPLGSILPEPDQRSARIR